MAFMNQVNTFFGAENNPDGEAEPNEKTPFNHSTVSENIKATPAYLKRQGEKLASRMRAGNLSYRIFAFLGGLAMMFAAIFDILERLITGTSGESSFIINFYTFCFGIFICTLEGKVFACPVRWIRTIKFYFRVLDYTWGKGCLFIFSGSLPITNPDRVHNMVGAYMVGIGLITIISSIGAGTRLAELHQLIENQTALRSTFQRYDLKGDGFLNVEEFGYMMADLGIRTNLQQTVACFNTIDKNDDEMISYEEFKRWWQVWREKNSESDRALANVIV